MNIVVETEFGKRIAEVGDPKRVLLSLAERSRQDASSLLRYIDPYGDVVFNYLQTPQLREELQRFESQASPETAEIIRDVVRLTALCEEEPHRYLKILGD